MNNFKFVRRATERDLEVRKSRIDKSKNKATLDQLQKISDIIIKLHDEYYEIQNNEFINKITLQYEEKKFNYEINTDKFDRIVESIKNGEKPKCNCQSDLIYHNTHFELLGCRNYNDTNFEHFKMYRPEKTRMSLEQRLFEYPFEVKKHYLSDICKSLSIKVKASDLYEFLILNKIKLWRNDITREFFYTARDAQELSRKRENLIYSELQKKYKKIEKQLVIAYQYNYENFIRFAIPDVIVFDNKNIIIYEQKKSIENISFLQTELYVDLIKEMVDDSFNVIVKFVIEEDYPFMPNFVNKHDILTLKTLL